MYQRKAATLEMLHPTHDATLNPSSPAVQPRARRQSGGAAVVLHEAGLLDLKDLELHRELGAASPV
jgi:hypothetical protein